MTATPDEIDKLVLSDEERVKNLKERKAELKAEFQMAQELGQDTGPILDEAVEIQNEITSREETSK